MRLLFTHQDHQAAAVAAVVDVFDGQPRTAGPVNAPIHLDPARLLTNIQAVQRRNGLRPDSGLADSTAAPGVPNLDVEMETGTGKTYVYLRTVLELHRRYGWSKFIVVVPSVAIREGVAGTVALTADHFFAEFGTRIHSFVYDSQRLPDIEDFATEPGIRLMIINIQAFNATGREQRRIYEELDAFGSRRPIDVIRATRPVVIVDEPQKMGAAKSLRALSRLGATLLLRYSATHTVNHTPVYRLDAVEAYRRRLVKKIAVRGITDVDATDAATTPGADGETRRRLQIREVVRAHLAAERRLFGRRVKVLSLLFIDEVRRYRDYDAPDTRGDYARIFEAEYAAAVAELLAETGLDPDYADLLRRDEPAEVHRGYFSVDRRTGRLVDDHGAVRRSGPDRGLSADRDAYDLILRDRQRLLSPAEPVRFLFSHSALREGWDNPNVFVLGMLKRSDNTVSRRQEVGRGLRLAVNWDGIRLDDPDTVHEVNVLTVVTDESYTDFVTGLQRELADDVGERADEIVPTDDRSPGDRGAAPSPREEFRRRWGQAVRRPPQRIAFDTAELVADAIAALDSGLRIGEEEFRIETGAQDDESGFAAPVVEASAGGLDGSAATAPLSAVYDLVGELAERTGLLRRTVVEILTGITREVFDGYRRDPERFITEAARIIGAVSAAPTVAVLAPDPAGTWRLVAMFTVAQLGEPRAEHSPVAAPVTAYRALPGLTLPTPFGDHLVETVYATGEGAARRLYAVAPTGGRLTSAAFLDADPAELDRARAVIPGLGDPPRVSGARVTEAPAGELPDLG